MSDIQIDKAYKRVNDALEKFSVGSLLIGFYQGDTLAIIIGFTFLTLSVVQSLYAGYIRRTP
jgi:hypothetical protein